MHVRTSPSYVGLKPASAAASRTHRASSKKKDTKPELTLRRALYAKGFRYRVDVKTLPGRPDVVFTSARVAVFVDGDFWHGRDLETRLARLADGHNAPYWVAKIRTNVERDERNAQSLASLGWTALRFWASDVEADPERAAEAISREVFSGINAKSADLDRISR